MLCYSYKWQTDKRVRVVALPDFPKAYNADPFDDKEMVAGLWNLLNDADIIVAHNGKEFDTRKINARFLKHGMRPPSPYKVVDTLLTARSRFKLNSNSLGDLGHYLGLGEKAKTGGFDLWFQCMRSNPVAWNNMRRYAKQDIVLLEKVYYALLPWDNYHPNITLGMGRGLLCPACGSAKVQLRGWEYLKSWRAQRFQCTSCGRWSKGDREKLPQQVLQ
jgi:DNA polymerase elongation subunit (family B)